MSAPPPSEPSDGWCEHMKTRTLVIPSITFVRDASSCIDQLEPHSSGTVIVKQETKKEIATKKAKNDFKSKNVSTEINVIGLTVDEAVPLVDKYLDDVYLSSIKSVRIVHGKGTGKLREGIHKFLRKEPHVKSFRLGTFGEGEMGVTIVELKKWVSRDKVFY